MTLDGNAELFGFGKGMKRVKRHLKRWSALVLTAVGLAACGGVMEGNLLKEDFWAGSPLWGDNEADLGLAEMAKGNYVAAEGHFKQAVKRNPRDAHALLGLGILYQNTGQIVKAREMYEALLAIRPDQSQQFVVWKNISTRPISEIASVNLALLESGGVLSSMGRGAAGIQGLGNEPVSPYVFPTAGDQALGQPPVSSGPAGSAIIGRPAISQPPSLASRAPASGSPGMVGLSNGDSNIISRFKTLRALSEQGLITQGEYATRRQANIGALLPLTSPPPAAGLDRTVPSTEQISGRLRAISRGLEMRAITISQHSAERTMILDALLPSAPVSVANPGGPPNGLMEAADAVRRLEHLKGSAFITSDEYTRERQAIEQALQPAAATRASAAMPASAQTAKATPAEMSAKAMPSGPLPAVHLASYRSKKQAERGWSQLRRAHRKLLGSLQSEITKTNLGPGKGVFYRLKAGPVADKAAAASLCRKLKNRRQYCEPSIMNSG